MLDAEADIEVVGEACTGEALLAQLAETPADVVLLDLHMPGMAGLEVVRELRERHPQVEVLVLTMQGDVEAIAELFQAGVRGFLQKTASWSEVLYGLRMVAEAQSFLCTDLGLAALQAVCTGGVAPAAVAAAAPEMPEVDLTELLTSRESEVLRLVAEGLTNQEIADQLFTSKRTVETHRQNLLAKTKAKNTAALIRLAVSAGLLE